MSTIVAAYFVLYMAAAKSALLFTVMNVDEEL
jgi:hypothetical protein